MTWARPLIAQPLVHAGRQAWRQTLNLWNKASIYLPVLLMGALALGTYWLVRNSPVISVPQLSTEVLHESDYFMRHFTIKNYDESGQLKSEINGTEARHYPDTDILEIDNARISSTGADGRFVVSSGNRALSNGDGSEVQLLGNARVVREASKDNAGNELPRMEFQGEFLAAFVKDERVTSHKPVVLTRGADQFTGDTFAYDNMTGIAELKGRVKGLLMPRKISRSTP